ncbi:MAG: PAS-domain containing protein [Rhodospirillales bacterium]|nr:PAS-domain containing protein [Rhodospirillales bacterium]
MSQSPRHRRPRRSRAGLPRDMMRRGAEQRRNRIETGATLVLGVAALAAFGMIALVWLLSASMIDDRTAAVRLAAQQHAARSAALLADAQRNELESINQALIAMRTNWRADPGHFRLDDWLHRLPALDDLTHEFFQTDAKQVIIADSDPRALGLGLGSRALARRSTLTQFQDKALFGPAAPVIGFRAWSMTLALPLKTQDGHQAGEIGIFYRTRILPDVYAGAMLGEHGFAALIETGDGVINAVAGPAAAVDANHIVHSRMFTAMQAHGDTLWTGPSALDGVRRIHAFHPVPGWRLAVAVGLDERDAMAPARLFATRAHGVAALASVLVLVAMGWLVREILFRRSLGLARRAQSKLRGEVEAAGVESRAALGEARFLAAQLAALGTTLDGGWAAFDANLDLAGVSPSFASLSGLAAESLVRGLSLDGFWRLAAAAGALGDVDIEAEVDARLASAKAEQPGSEAWHTAAGVVELHRLPLTGGGLLLVFTGHGGGSEWA